MGTQPGGVEDLYKEHHARLWRALLAYSGDPEVASDAAAEAFTQALARFDELSSPVDWIWVSAFRIARGLLGEQHRRPVFVGRLDHEIPEPVDHLVDALRELSERQRVAVVLHDYADRSTREIAELLGISVATVHVHLSLGRRRLRDLLEVSDVQRT